MSSDDELGTGGNPGHYPFGMAGRTATWDGQAWTGQKQAAPEVVTFPTWKHHRLPFLRHRWFWLCVVGLIVMAIPAFVASTTGSPALQPVLLLGALLFMFGGALIVMEHMAPTGISSVRLIALWGLASGAVGVGLAYLVEEVLLPDQVSETVLLWQSGVTEETAKLLVPVLLLAFGGSTFRTPRAGLLLVLLSGATFGAIELVMYVMNTRGNGAIATVLMRSTAELLHPYVTAFAAVLIWLGAWRRQRIVTLVGCVGWALAVAMHSLHDGLMGLANSNLSSTNTQGYDSVGAAVGYGMAGLLWELVYTVIFFLILRFVARELTPPVACPVNAPSWRPRIRPWGMAKTERVGTVRYPQAEAIGE